MYGTRYKDEISTEQVSTITEQIPVLPTRLDGHLQLQLQHGRHPDDVPHHLLPFLPRHGPGHADLVVPAGLS